VAWGCRATAGCGTLVSQRSLRALWIASSLTSIESMMLRSIGVTARTLVIFAFLLLMPLLAFPPVTQWVQDRAAALRPMLAGLVDGADVLAPQHRAPELETVALPEPTDAPQCCHPAIPETRAPQPHPAHQPHTLASSLQHELDRLRELGASSMRWQAEGAGERFVCHVPLDVGGVYARQFAAAAADRLASVRRVRQEIQSWRQTLRDRQGSVEIEVGLHIPAAQLLRGRRALPEDRRGDASARRGLP
jgi:hypothetical protein